MKPALLITILALSFFNCFSQVKIVDLPETLQPSSGYLPITLSGQTYKVKAANIGSAFCRNTDLLKTLTAMAYLRATVSDTIRGGDFIARNAADGFVVDSGIVFPSATTGVVWVRDISQSSAINFKWFGAKGDGVNDDSKALKYLRNFLFATKNRNIYIPNGRYLINDTVLFRFGVTITGENRDSTFLIRGFGAGFGPIGALTFLSGNSSQLITGIHISNITLFGNTVALGYNAFIHLLALHGTKGAIIENCFFSEFRGDGIYVGAGVSSSDPTALRFNRNATIRNCIFDGGSGTQFKNRNGISIIDCNGINITNCYFHHIGNNSLSSSVGAIDFERNNGDSSLVEASNITNNIFDSINTTNTAAITYHSTVNPPLRDRADFVNVAYNQFNFCYFGVEIASSFSILSTLDKERMDINIHDNSFKYNISYAVKLNGRRITITHNSFRGDVNNECNILLGHLQTISDLPAQDVEIGYNSFDSCGGSGVVEVDNARGLDIHDNQFTDGVYPVYFYADAISSSRRKLDYITIRNNRFTAPTNADIALSAKYFIRVPSGFNVTNFLINGNSEVSGNILGGKISMYSGGSEFYLNHSTISAPPTTGSWDVGNELYSAISTTGSYKLVCAKGGTYGTDGLVNTLAATNGSNYFVYDSSAHGNITYSHLRAGQYVSITGSSKLYKIIHIKDSTGFYTDNSFDGTSGTCTATWTAPTFVNVSVNQQYSQITTTVTKTVGNVSQFYEATSLTADRTVTIANDATTMPGVKIHFINTSTSNNLIVAPGSGVTINGSTSSYTVKPNEVFDLLCVGTNQYEVYYNIKTYTTSGGGGSNPSTIALASNQATTSSTLSDVSGMAIALGASKKYRITGVLNTACDNTGGIQIAFTIPSGATMFIAATGSKAQLNLLGMNSYTASGTSGGVPFNTAAASGIVTFVGYVTTSSTAGNVQLQFRSTTATQTSTIATGSQMDVTEVQ